MEFFYFYLQVFIEHELRRHASGVTATISRSATKISTRLVTAPVFVALYQHVIFILVGKAATSLQHGVASLF